MAKSKRTSFKGRGGPPTPRAPGKVDKHAAPKLPRSYNPMNYA